MKQLLLFAAALLQSALPLLAGDAPAFSPLFSDHMVLQRDLALPVWGTAEPGETVAVAFAGQVKTTTADADRKWQVKLDPLAASFDGRELTVRSGSAESRVADVVVGDVWLCSGQSNMHFRMASVEDAAKEIAGMNRPAVRFFTVAQRFGQQPLDEVEGRWLPVTPATAADCSAVACYFGAALHEKIGVPVGLVVSSVGGTRIESWMRPATLAATGKSASLVAKWKDVSAAEFERIGATYAEFQRERDQVHPVAVREAKAQGKPVPPPPVAPKLRCHDAPSALHHGMIDSLQPFAIRGAIWYQGESNSGQPGPYEKLLPAMIADWRGVWGKDLPFLFVQLASYRATHPAFREAQQRIWQNTPHTAMAVTTDIGDPANIHPVRKRPVGERLALAARAVAYGEPVGYSGPVFKEMKADGNRAVISFTHPGKGLAAKGEELAGFTIAGKDGRFFPAQAVIEGEQVAVFSAKVPRPSAVRYNWAMNTEGNLYNLDGLPAAPFRSDAPPSGTAE